MAARRGSALRRGDRGAHGRAAGGGRPPRPPGRHRSARRGLGPRQPRRRARLRPAGVAAAGGVAYGSRRWRSPVERRALAALGLFAAALGLLALASTYEALLLGMLVL